MASYRSRVLTFKKIYIQWVFNYFIYRFNTGIILYHLENLKPIEWDQLWSRIAKRTASVFGATRLADQDIINAVITQNSEFVYRVPCQWNTQLSDHTHSYKCYNNNQIKVNSFQFVIFKIKKYHFRLCIGIPLENLM